MCQEVLQAPFCDVHFGILMAYELLQPMRRSSRTARRWWWRTYLRQVLKDSEALVVPRSPHLLRG